jgi:ATP-dependent DNA helicase PIF1
MNTLTNEQKYVIDCLLEGNNVFLGGGAGCGKSYLISAIYNEFPALKKMYMETKGVGLSKLPRIQLTALTGCASLLLGNKAKTLHSWAGIGLGKGTVQELFTKIRKNQKALRNWLCTDLLIIDEISMMTGELLDKLNQLGKKLRPVKDKPFGGIQLMLVGDFFQLPPVNKNKDEPLKFTFESDAWAELFSDKSKGICIELQQIQRQKDITFQKVLKESRIGELSRKSCEILQKCQGRKWQDNLIRPTLLFPRRAEVDMINDSNLRALEGRHYKYDVKLVYDGKAPIGFDIQDETFKRVLEQFDTEAGYQRQLELCKDAQVMLIANVYPDEGLVNGSRGVVVGFCEATDLPIVQFLNGVKKTVGAHTWPIEDYEFVARSQIPLRLAYSVTIHKSQGATLDSALVDIGSGVFEFGQAYVALSRARSLDALYVYDFEPTAFKAHPRVKEFYSKLKVVTIDDIQVEFIMDKVLELSDKSIPEDAKIISGSTSELIRGVQVIKLDS